jgi:DNA-directed RNA polymerase alpha subunit
VLNLTCAPARWTRCRDPHGIHRQYRQGLRSIRTQPAEDAPIGLIPVDSLYSPGAQGLLPGREYARCQILDYDKLTLQVETNGAVALEDAPAYAARILQDQLNVFVNFEEPRKGSHHGSHSRPRVQSGLS